MFIAATLLVCLNLAVFVGTLFLVDDSSRHVLPATIAVSLLGVSLVLARSLRRRFAHASVAVRRSFGIILPVAGVAVALWSYSEAQGKLARHGRDLAQALAAENEISGHVKRLESNLQIAKRRLAQGSSFLDGGYLRQMEIEIHQRRQAREEVQRRVAQLERQPKFLWACVVLAGIYGLVCLVAGSLYVFRNPEAEAVPVVAKPAPLAANTPTAPGLQPDHLSGREAS